MSPAFGYGATAANVGSIINRLAGGPPELSAGLDLGAGLATTAGGIAAGGAASGGAAAASAAAGGAAAPALGAVLGPLGVAFALKAFGDIRNANVEAENIKKAKKGLATFQQDPDVRNLAATLGAAKGGDPAAVASVQRALQAAMRGASALTYPENGNPNALAPYFKAIYNSVIGTPAFGPTVIAAGKALMPQGPWDQGYERQVSYAYDLLNQVGYGSPAFYGPPSGYDARLGTGRGLDEARVRAINAAANWRTVLPPVSVSETPSGPPPGYTRGTGYSSGQYVPTAIPAVPGMEPPAGFTRGTGMSSAQFVPRLSGGAFGIAA